jgi:flagellar hook-length control protein FliK
MELPAPAADTLAHAEASASKGRPAFPAALEAAQVERSASVVPGSHNDARGEAAGEEGDAGEGDDSAAAVAGAVVGLPIVDSFVPLLVPAGLAPQSVSATAVPTPEVEAASASLESDRGNFSRLRQILAGAAATVAGDGAIAAQPDATAARPDATAVPGALSLGEDIARTAGAAGEADTAGATNAVGAQATSEVGGESREEKATAARRLVASAVAVAAGDSVAPDSATPDAAMASVPSQAEKPAPRVQTDAPAAEPARTSGPEAGSAAGSPAAAPSGGDIGGTAAADGTGGADSRRVNATVQPPAGHAAASRDDSGPRVSQPAPESTPPAREMQAVPRGAAATAAGRHDHAGGPAASTAAPQAALAATADSAPGGRALAQPSDGVAGRAATTITADAVAVASGQGTRAQERETARHRDAGGEASPDAESVSAGRTAAKFATATPAERRVQTSLQLTAGAGRVTEREQRVVAAEARLAEIDPLALPEGGRGSQSLATAGASRPSSAGETRAGINAPPGLTAWAERVVGAIRLATARGGGEMRLRLEPEGLGHIDVRISLAHDGVRAVLLAEHDATRTLLANGQHLLQAALERSDLRLAGFSVDLGFGAGAGAFADGDGRSETLPGVPETLMADEALRPNADPVPIAGPPEPGRLSLRV